MDPIEPIVPPASEPRRLGTVRRSLATFGLAVGLLAVGGAAVVLAASPDPSASPAPAATENPSATDTPSTRGDHGDCPEGTDGGQNGGGSDDSGTSPSTAPSTDSPSPAATPAV